MNRLWNYGRHWLKAKGRHGTHSPFVYAFVEQVLRNKNKIKAEQVEQVPVPPAALSLREKKLLYKTLYFLKPAQVLLPEGSGLDWIKAIVKHSVPGATVVHHAGLFDTGHAPQALLVIPAARAYHACFEKAIKAGIAVLVYHPHGSAENLLYWEAWYTDPVVKMSLDYWYFGLLMNDIAFKQKQHFRLR